MSEYVCEVAFGVEVYGNGMLRGYERIEERREEVVRCRDCAHASPDGLDCDPDELYCVAMDTVMAPDGFCSLGRRKEAQWQSES